MPFVIELNSYAFFRQFLDLAIDGFSVFCAGVYRELFRSVVKYVVEDVFVRMTVEAEYFVALLETEFSRDAVFVNFYDPGHNDSLL